ncbi:MAG TPA: DNA repair exonuclease [Methanofastidiosum sp.]|nr:DNA repair exonuclease [Methanofastidiosum sp.]
MKLIHTADFHLSKKLRLDDFTKSLSKIKDCAFEYSVSTVVVAGDVFDKNTPDNEARAVFYEWLSSLLNTNIHVLILTGTHDAQQLAHGLLPLKRLNLEYLHIYDSLCVDVISELKLYVLTIPHLIRPDFGMIKKKLDEFDSLEKSDGWLKIVIGHFAIIGTEVRNGFEILEKSEDFVLPLTWFQQLKSVDYIALGHIHRHQQLLKNMVYAGSIERVNFGEKENKPCFVEVDIDGKECKIQTVPFDVRPMVDIRATNDLEEQLKSLQSGTLVRLKVTEDQGINFRQIRKLIDDTGLLFYGIQRESIEVTPITNMSVEERQGWVDIVLRKIDEMKDYNKELLKSLFYSAYQKTEGSIDENTEIKF